MQVFQHRKFAIYGHDEVMQTLNRHLKADAAHTVTVLECKHYSLFFCGGVTAFRIVINEERKRRQMCQHVYYGHSMHTKEAETQMQGLRNDEISPSSANLNKLVPPVFAAPIPLDICIFMIVEENRSTERKYVEKRVIIKVVDGCTGLGLLAGRWT
jgi:hypothetical protein